jgi:hypothetical protein
MTWDNLDRTTHGATSRELERRPKLYTTWQNMRNRCNGPNNARYWDYGGRGIYVDARWNDFTAFASDMGDPPSPLHTLDRINPDGPYARWNCRWATRQEQQANKRMSRPKQERWTSLMLDYLSE